MSEILFTPAGVLDLLVQIDELKELNIGISEGLDGVLELTVGNSIYRLLDDSIHDVMVDDSVVEQVEEINISAYEDLSESGEVDLQEPVRSGILKEIAKSLLLGGLIRLGVKFNLVK